MANFVFDSLTGDTSNDVTTHTGETGATWIRHSTYPSSSTQLVTNELRGGAATVSIYYASGSPAGAEYDVSAPLHVLIAGTQLSTGVMARIDTATDTMYWARYSSNGWYLHKSVAGTFTDLGFYAQALTTGQIYNLRFEVRNATKKLFVDNVERISSTDNSITAAGKAGIFFYKGDGLLSMVDFTAADVVGPATATTIPTYPSSGTVGVASTNFTVGANGTITGTVIITPSDGGGGGTFTPTTVSISSGTPTGTFTYTPSSTGVKTISTTNNGGLANAASLSYTSNAAGGDTTPPTLTGAITASAITQTTYTLSWPTGSDNVAVTAYEYSLDAGTTYTGNGTATTVNVTGRTAGATDQVRVRAKDAAGNVSTPVLSTTVTLLSASSGTLTTPQPLKNNTATVQPNLTGLVVQVLLGSTGAVVVGKTGQTTNASGYLAVTDATITPGTAYFLAFVNPATGAAGITNKITAV